MRSLVSIENNVLYSTIPENIYPNENMVKLLFEKFDQWPDREILIDGVTGKSWTAKEFKKAVSCVSFNFINDFNLVKDDVVCFHCYNCDLLAIGTIAVIAAGGIFAACSANGPYYELYNVVSLTKSSYLVVGIDQLDNACKVALNCNHIKRIFVIDNEQSDESHNIYPFSRLLVNSFREIFSPVAVSQDDVCIILFSSGTTGLPKPVPRTHRNVLANQNCNREAFHFAHEDDIIPVPWSLCYSSQMKLMTMSLFAGSKAVIFLDYGIEMFVSYIHKYKFNKAILVPSYITQMVQTDIASNYDISSLIDILVTGSMLAESTAMAFVNKFKIKYLRQLYGTTEVSTCVMQRRDDCPNENVRCAGIVTPGYSVKIVDRNTGIALGPNCVGELYTKGPSVMSGFLNMPKENLEAFDKDGYYKTGDAAYYNTSGHIYIVDRYKNILKFEGGAVSCAELESILITHPRIKDACVIGIEHDIYGEVPRAYVVLDHGQLTSEDVMDFVDSHVDEYKRLFGGVVFVDNIPKNSFGKIKRNPLYMSTKEKL